MILFDFFLLYYIINKMTNYLTLLIFLFGEFPSKPKIISHIFNKYIIFKYLLLILCIYLNLKSIKNTTIFFLIYYFICSFDQYYIN